MTKLKRFHANSCSPVKGKGMLWILDIPLKDSSPEVGETIVIYGLKKTVLEVQENVVPTTLPFNMRKVGVITT